MERMREVILCSFLSISKRSLLDETKAISMPEKKAEKAIVIRICMMISIVIRVFYLFCGLLFFKLSCGWVVTVGAVSSTVNIPVVFFISYSVKSWLDSNP